MNSLARALIWNACFLEFTDESLLDPDMAVTQLEQLASLMQEASIEERHIFVRECLLEADAVAARGAAGGAETATFIRGLPESLGID